MEKERNTFKGSIGFVLAAAGSAVGLGNLWRFPTLAARNGGGIFLLIYLILAITFGYTLLTTEIAIGRKTAQSPLTAYSKIKRGWKWLGVLSCLVPMIILPYYCAIGGWVIQYFQTFTLGGGMATAEDGYFTGFITGEWQPVVMMLIFLAMVVAVILLGVNKGIESFSKIIMPILILLVIGIAIFSLTLNHTDENGVTRTGLEGLVKYVVPDFSQITFSSLFTTVVDAMGQLFFSLSIAMGIMIAYGSYMPKTVNMSKSITQIELFDTGIAILAGMMIVPAVFTFMGTEGMSASGPSLMFVSLPKVFASMGFVGNIIGALFFAMVLFAALTSAISIMEAVVSSLMDQFHLSRVAAVLIETGIALLGALCVCFGYNFFYFDLTLPNGSVGQILDIMDFVSNNILMPIIAIGTCILIGWVAKPKTVIEEVEQGGAKMSRKWLYIVMIKFIAPAMLILLFLRSSGILRF